MPNKRYMNEQCKTIFKFNCRDLFFLTQDLRLLCVCDIVEWVRQNSLSTRFMIMIRDDGRR